MSEEIETLIDTEVKEEVQIVEKVEPVVQTAEPIVKKDKKKKKKVKTCNEDEESEFNILAIGGGLLFASILIGGLLSTVKYD